MIPRGVASAALAGWPQGRPPPARPWPPPRPGSALRLRRLRRLFPRVVLRSDYFRLMYRGDDARAAIHVALAEWLAAAPIR